MSTSGLYGYIENGSYVAMRNHSDSYPSGLGAEFFTACKNGDFSGYYAITEENQIHFIHNSLFCEWAYFFEKDTRIFEIWKGFQTIADPKNPFGQQKVHDYFPCKRIFKGDIDSINLDIFNKDIEKILISFERNNTLNLILNEKDTLR
jgi:hypothetical protein